MRQTTARPTVRTYFGFPAEGRADHAELAPAWEQIYCTDDERTLPFSHAREFGNRVRAICEPFGYTLIDLPCVYVEERDGPLSSPAGEAP